MSIFVLDCPGALEAHIRVTSVLGMICVVLKRTGPLASLNNYSLFNGSRGIGVGRKFVGTENQSKENSLKK